MHRAATKAKPQRSAVPEQGSAVAAPRPEDRAASVSRTPGPVGVSCSEDRAADVVRTPGPVGVSCSEDRAAGVSRAPGPVRAAGTGGTARTDPAPEAPGSPGASRAPAPGSPGPARRWHLWHLLPTPTGTPFTFGYALLLLATSLYAQFGDPDTVSAMLRASSTDVDHLTRAPLVALVGSALWVAGGPASPYALGFLVVLTALERRIGGLRSAGVFAFGHVVASLATELPVGFAVALGHLPETSLYRLDFGISFGLMACVGALAGVLRLRWLRWGLLGAVGLVLAQDLIAYVDPLTALGHPLALCLGLATWPLVRRWKAERDAPSYL
ncbi:rhomboid-like protein [Streptomyces sp. CA-294286]|uniref:rhomboid-like protein n=1 Tax=Streptomyces sp. CA-294286 TaxID=3240070 RepID=UPI003D93F55A